MTLCSDNAAYPCLPSYERAPPAHLPVYTSPPTTVPSDNGPPPPRPLLRAAVLNAAAISPCSRERSVPSRSARYAAFRSLRSYPLCANPLETVDRSDALQLRELVSASTKWQDASSCFMALLFANGISWSRWFETRPPRCERKETSHPPPSFPMQTWNPSPAPTRRWYENRGQDTHIRHSGARRIPAPQEPSPIQSPNPVGRCHFHLPWCR